MNSVGVRWITTVEDIGPWWKVNLLTATYKRSPQLDPHHLQLQFCPRFLIFFGFNISIITFNWIWSHPIAISSPWCLLSLLQLQCLKKLNTDKMFRFWLLKRYFCDDISTRHIDITRDRDDPISETNCPNYITSATIAQ